MTERPNTVKRVIRRELLLFAGLFFCGLLLLPILVYIVGQQVFGSYAGSGFGDFFGSLGARLRGGEFYAWFLVLSPYLAVQTLRGMWAGWRLTAATDERRKQAASKT